MLSKKLNLDKIDQKIISLIQENPSLTHTEIAEQIERSQPTVGMRIKKLEENGILKFQPGINFKNVQLTLATIELKTKNPDYVMEMGRFCPFVLNAFRLSGDKNICLLLASSELEKLDNVVNYHFRDNPDVDTVQMEVVTEIAKDFILPIDFDSENHSPNLEEGCGPQCKFLKAKEERKESVKA